MTVTPSSSSPDSAQDQADGLVLAGGGLLRLVSSGLALLSGLLLTVILVRTLGVAEYGVYALVLSVVGLVGIVADLGIGTGVARMSAFRTGRDSTAWAKRSLRISLISGASLTTLLAAAALLVRPELRVPLMVASPLVMVAALKAAQSGFLASLRRFAILESANIATTAATIALVLGAIVLAEPMSSGWALGAQVVARGAGVLALATICYQLLRRARGASLPSTRTVLGFSIPLLMGGIAGVVLSRSDVIMLGWIAGIEEAGRYAPILRILDVAPFALGGLAYYLFPVGAKMVREGNFDRLGAAYAAVTKWGVVMVLPFLATMLLLPMAIVEALFGKGFGSMRATTSVLAFGYAVNALAGVNGVVLVALGAVRQVAIRSGILASVNIALNALLIPAFGILGAAVSTTTVMILLNLVNTLLVVRLAGVHPFRKDLLLVVLVQVGAATIALVGVIALDLTDQLLGAVALFVVVSGSGLAVGLATLRPAERRLLARVPGVGVLVAGRETR